MPFPIPAIHVIAIGQQQLGNLPKYYVSFEKESCKIGAFFCKRPCHVQAIQPIVQLGAAECFIVLQYDAVCGSVMLPCMRALERNGVCIFTCSCEYVHIHMRRTLMCIHIYVSLYNAHICISI